MKRMLLIAALVTAPVLCSLPASAEPEPVTDFPAAAAPMTGPMISIAPAAIAPTSNGDIAFVIEGWNFDRKADVLLNSTSLNSSCTGGTSLKDDSVKTDRDGYFNFVAVAKSCIEGLYSVEANERTSDTTVTADFAVAQTARTGVAKLNVTPAKADAAGNISYVVDGSEFQPNTVVVLNSRGLNAACEGTSSLRNVKVVTDRNGRFLLPAAAKNCNTGSYTIEATEATGARQTRVAKIAVTEAK